MRALVYVRMVLWSFFGIRRSAGANEELAQVKPLAVLATAIVLATLFGLALWGIANLAAGTLAN
jgi:hypothetical protein